MRDIRLFWFPEKSVLLNFIVLLHIFTIPIILFTGKCYTISLFIHWYTNMHYTCKYQYNTRLMKKEKERKKEPTVFFSQGASAFCHSPLASATALKWII